MSSPCFLSFFSCFDDGLLFICSELSFFSFISSHIPFSSSFHFQWIDEKYNIWIILEKKNWNEMKLFFVIDHFIDVSGWQFVNPILLLWFLSSSSSFLFLSVRISSLSFPSLNWSRVFTHFLTYYIILSPMTFLEHHRNIIIVISFLIDFHSLCFHSV